MNAPDAVVIGGGVIGCAVARELARAGTQTVVVERDRPGTHASRAAAGMLSPQAEADRPDAFLSLLRESRSLYPAFAAALREETGIDVGYRDEGTLLVALTEQDEREMEARFRWQAEIGLPVERLTPAEARALEPAITPALRGALRFPEDHQVDNRRLAGALWAAAVRAGAEFRLGAEVVRVLRAGDGVGGVELAGGERIGAPVVVLAAGSWAGRVAGLPAPLPVHPVHGQLLALERLPPLLRHVVDSPRAYLVPRADGRLILGATVEDTGFHRAVTPAGVLEILRGALEIAPALRDLPLVDLWSGLRPGTPDHRPILGPDPSVRGLYYATGHYRNGILLTPISAQIIGALVRGGEVGRDLAPFSLARFAAPTPSDPRPGSGPGARSSPAG